MIAVILYYTGLTLAFILATLLIYATVSHFKAMRALDFYEK